MLQRTKRLLGEQTSRILQEKDSDLINNAAGKSNFSFAQSFFFALLFTLAVAHRLHAFVKRYFLDTGRECFINYQ